MEMQHLSILSQLEETKKDKKKKGGWTCSLVLRSLHKQVSGDGLFWFKVWSHCIKYTFTENWETEHENCRDLTSEIGAGQKEKNSLLRRQKTQFEPFERDLCCYHTIPMLA